MQRPLVPSGAGAAQWRYLGFLKRFRKIAKLFSGSFFETATRLFAPVLEKVAMDEFGKEAAVDVSILKSGLLGLAGDGSLRGMSLNDERKRSSEIIPRAKFL